MLDILGPFSAGGFTGVCNRHPIGLCALNGCGLLCLNHTAVEGERIWGDGDSHVLRGELTPGTTPARLPTYPLTPWLAGCLSGPATSLQGELGSAEGGHSTEVCPLSPGLQSVGVYRQPRPHSVLPELPAGLGPLHLPVGHPALLPVLPSAPPQRLHRPLLPLQAQDGQGPGARLRVGLGLKGGGGVGVLFLMSPFPHPPAAGQGS